VRANKLKVGRELPQHKRQGLLRGKKKNFIMPQSLLKKLAQRKLKEQKGQGDSKILEKQAQRLI
jgi:hypothetical protein